MKEMNWQDKQVMWKDVKDREETHDAKWFKKKGDELVDSVWGDSVAGNSTWNNGEGEVGELGWQEEAGTEPGAIGRLSYEDLP